MERRAFWPVLRPHVSRTHTVAEFPSVYLLGEAHCDRLCSHVFRDGPAGIVVHTAVQRSHKVFQPRASTGSSQRHDLAARDLLFPARGTVARALEHADLMDVWRAGGNGLGLAQVS